MAIERETLRAWHRLFGLLLTDLFSGSPFVVEVERGLASCPLPEPLEPVRQFRAAFPLVRELRDE
jgi:hypothetical protein